ncbi:hypothetical protein KKG22_05520 [Patescibacteria group bacterium]|nr:hypothetical protein [Patescibacteria group bacterium]MBU1721536.1 hypothetical protein [Patescibacteria group bacterium]MBU1901502.1 hypothetical protein [Patescibacteria group bacterium]
MKGDIMSNSKNINSARNLTTSIVGQALRALPVSVNCYYGDPTLQWGDTMEKLERLAETGHTGPVSIITKGAIGPQRAADLARLVLPGLVVMVSVSGLGRAFEEVGHAHRYTTLRNLREAGVKAFAAVRPLTPPYNTSREVLTEIFQNLQAAGCEVACVSGFRGDASLIEEMSPEEGTEWVLRVKQMTGFDLVMECARENGIRLFTRVNCAVSYLTGRPSPFNPYWGSPQLVRCDAIECPLRGTCGPTEPNPEILAWLRQVGYDLEYQPAPQKACSFSSDTRLNCKSCCTTCYVERQPRVVVRNARTLGDLTFCRFVLGGTLCVKPGMIDEGGLDVGHVKVLQEAVGGANLHCLNSWWPWSAQLEKCFGCRYCILHHYTDRSSVGCAPADLEHMLQR